MSKFCYNCGKPLEENQVVCLNCGVAVKKTNSQTLEGKSKIAAALLAFFLGAFGVHNFYLGKKGTATTQLLITLLSCGILSFISGIWSFIEFVMILTGSINTDAEGNPLI